MKTTTDSGHNSEEAALQEAHKAMAPRQKKIWPWVLGSQALVLIIGYFGMPYFTTHLVFDQEAMEAEEALVAERARAYREKEQAERTDREIHEEHADPLKRQEREKRRQEVLAHVYELEAIAIRLREERDAQLGRLMDTSPEDLPEGIETKLEESLRKFSEATTTLKENDTVADRELFEKSANELLAAADESRKKANTPTGLDMQDRETLSDRLATTETSLDELQNSNRDAWSDQQTDELADAQKMANLLNSLPRQIKNAQKQIQSADSRLDQQRNRIHDEIKREIDRVKQSHRGMLAHKNRSPEIKEFSDALENLQALTQKQKNENTWKQEDYESSFKAIKAAADGAKERLGEVQKLGDQRETKALADLAGNHQRQAEAQRKEWEQLTKKQADKTKESNQALATAIDKAGKQWEKTKSHLASGETNAHDKAFRNLIQKAQKQHKESSPATANSANDFRKEADKLAQAIKQTASNAQEAMQESIRLHQTLQSLSGELEKHSQTLRKQEDDKRNLAKRIQGDLQRAQKQLNDKARRASPALANKENKTPPGEAAKKVAEGLHETNEQAKEITGEEDLSKGLAARSKALTELKKDAQRLTQSQQTAQKGIAKDESNKLDQSLANLEKSLGRRHNDFIRQTTTTKQNIERQEANLQKALDQIKAASAKAQDLTSPEAKRVAGTLKSLPEKAPTILKEPSEERIAKASEQTKDWLQRAKGEAPVRQVQMADTKQALRELSEAMTEAGLTRQNADAAAALLEEGPLEFPKVDPASLEDAVATAESLHEQIEDDFQTVRAAEIAARTGQSLEQMQRLADTLSQDDSEIEVPESNPEINTVGDLREYRKAMDATVSQTESLTQNARTLQRQALGDDNPGLAQALSSGGAQTGGTGSTVNVGVNPRRRNAPVHDNTRHRMTFEDVHIPTGRIDVKKVKAEALPGRRFTDESARQGWFYVDTWYVIGPWENFGKVNWSNVHPPEIEVDLAKSYSDGKGGRELRWQFTQHPAIRCDVPDETTNSSYYAYTELYFDKPREMLIAVASNDSGKLWIDDQVIWQDNGMSSWNLDEEFRKVRFKKGFSKILIRVENGPHECQFSLLLCPPDL